MVQHLMRITADTRHTRHTEIEWSGGEACLLQKRHDEAAQAAVDMESDAFLHRKLAESDNIVLSAIREVYCRANQLTRWATQNQNQTVNQCAI